MKLWHQKPRSEWTAHDWLYAAAGHLLKTAAENQDEPMSLAHAGRLVMDFADENCGAVE